VVDATESLDHANGIKFTEYTPRALAKSMRKALTLYQNPDWLEHYRANAMTADHSWESAVGEYLKLYERLVAPAQSVPAK
jgi:starch synthase